MEVGKGIWCEWYVHNVSLKSALYQLEEYGVKPQYIHIVNPPPADDLYKNHYLIIYRNPPYED